MKSLKKTIVIGLASILCLITSTTSFASSSDITLKVYPQDNYLPYHGAKSFESTYQENQEKQRLNTTYITVYGYDYEKGNKKYGSWRDGTSGGNSVSDITLTFDKGYDETYNTSFTASVSGEYTHGGTIGAHLGVELGKSDTYSLGSGASVTVPKGNHYLIQYRPIYYEYKVIETKYKEGYVPGYGMHRYAISTKTSYVDVFSHWDFRVIID